MNDVKKKKILYFVPEFPRISETFIYREIDRLIEFGNLDITVVSLVKGEGEISDRVKNVTHYERPNILTLIDAIFSFVLASPGQIFEICKLVGGKDPVPYLLSFKMPNEIEGRTSFLTKMSLTRFVLFIKGIAYAKLFAKYEPDHIHAHFFSSPSTIVMVAAKILGIPFSISAHARDIFVDGTLIPVKANESKFVAVCNTKAWEKAVDVAGREKSSKIRKIFHGIDADRVFNIIPEIKKPDRPAILTVARLVEKKGLRYLVEASKILRDRGIDHQVDIIGSGPLYKNLIDQIKSLGLEGNIKIHGEGKGLPFSKTAEFFKVADMFALPSTETIEGDVDGIPTVIIEAALARLPVVTTDAGSIRDLIDESCGIIVPQKDSHVLATEIEKLIYDYDLRNRLASEAYSKAKKTFDINKNVSELERLFLED